MDENFDAKGATRLVCQLYRTKTPAASAKVQATIDLQLKRFAYDEWVQDAIATLAYYASTDAIRDALSYLSADHPNRPILEDAIARRP